MRVLVKEPQKAPEERDVPYTLEALQDIVGGYIQHVVITPFGLGFLCDEEGKLKGYDPNFLTEHDQVIVGTVVFVRTDPQTLGFVDLTDTDVTLLTHSVLREV